MKIGVTAGFDKSLPALLIAEGLRQQGHELVGVWVVSPYSIRRVASLLRQGGLVAMANAAQRLRSTASQKPKNTGALTQIALKIGLSIPSLKEWCSQHQVVFHSVKNLNQHTALQSMEAANVDMLVYAGGGILDPQIIKLLNGYILNAHAGPLPYVRGMNAIEWAVLLGHPTAITIHWIDEGVDTGKVVALHALGMAPADGVEGLRERAQAQGVKAVLSTLKSLEKPSDLACDARTSAEKQCFTLSPALKELLGAKLSSLARENLDQI